MTNQPKDDQPLHPDFWKPKISYSFMLGGKKILQIKIKPLMAALILVFALFFVVILIFKYKQRLNYWQSAAINPEEFSTISDSTIFRRKKLPILQETITVLLLGLDARKGDFRPRCDAIHLLSFSPSEEKVIITSVPRGIYVDLPDIATPSAYLGNSCHIKGIDFAVEEIKKITALEPDYIVQINFSQALGVLRLLKLPTTPTLQFLRNRKSYYYGDYQRSHNQAVFIKDAFINYLDKATGWPDLAKRLAFKIVSIEKMEYETAEMILNWLVKLNLSVNSDKIELITKPDFLPQTKDIHFKIEDYTDIDWQNDEEFKKYQQELISYFDKLIEQAEKYVKQNSPEKACQLAQIPFSQQLWLQIEKQEARENYEQRIKAIIEACQKETD